MSDDDLAGKPLTAREKAVVEYLCLGMSGKEIARAMSIGARTVEYHRENIFKKLKVRNAVELVRLVYKIGESA